MSVNEWYEKERECACGDQFIRSTGEGPGAVAVVVVVFVLAHCAYLSDADMTATTVTSESSWWVMILLCRAGGEKEEGRGREGGKEGGRDRGRE